MQRPRPARADVYRDKHIGALFHKTLGGRKTDAAAAAGNHRNFALKPAHDDALEKVKVSEYPPGTRCMIYGMDQIIQDLPVSRLPKRSPMITHGAMVLPVVTRGMIEASATLKLSMP